MINHTPSPHLGGIKFVYFLGIGGIGMSALARYFIQSGVAVWGYDKVRTPLCEKLESEGIHIHYEARVQDINSVFLQGESEGAMVVYTPAIPTEFEEYVYFREKGVRLYKRAEVLGLICRDSFCIAVAGTHGKTTTSSLMAAVLMACDVSFTAFLGGISRSFDSNYICHQGQQRVFPSPVILVEADEYDRSFLHLRPDAVIITATDPDHLDIYGSDSAFRQAFNDFVLQMKTQGVGVFHHDVIIQIPPHIRAYSYGDKGDDTDYIMLDASMGDDAFSFTFKKSNGEKTPVALGIAGRHNALNATAVMAMADALGLPLEQVMKGLRSFKGIKRRFDVVFRHQDYWIVDDYAHHPTELDALISSVREMAGNKRITGVFQPHLFTRTRDFMDGFVQSLSQLDCCMLMDIYPAREQPIPGIDSSLMAAQIPSCIGVFTPESLVETIQESLPQVLLILGAGDIDRVVAPIEECYRKALERN